MYKQRIKILWTAIILLLPLIKSYSQSSSINTFSPYTLYGIGDMEYTGTTSTRSMGGIGIAYWDPYAVNIVNPASHATVVQNSFIFNFGLSGKQSYLKDNLTKTAENNFNINNIAIKFPLYKGIGFSVSVNPVSSVGYNIYRDETDPDILSDIGLVRYIYKGEGGISQYKAGIGFRVHERISLGADLIYYLGTITRENEQEISRVTSSDSYGNISVRNREEVSKILFDVGVQYDIIRTLERYLTFGAIYQPQAKLKNKLTKEFGSTSSSDSIYYQSLKNSVTVPEKIGVGMLYRTEKLGIAFDYSYQNWKKSFELPHEDNVSLTNTNSYNVGFEYTPNRLDIRKAMNRWTYRAGFRYTDMYLVKNNRETADKAITLGVGIPMKMAGFSAIDIGVELGQRGTTKHGLYRENYFRISVGFSLFGEDEWFVKRKYY